MSTPPTPTTIPGLQPLSGRDPHEPHRVSSPLELLLDLSFVVAFGVAGQQFAHLIASGHFWDGLLGFGFATYAIIWAWVNFSWFASAFDTDDWLYRLTVMLQMVGVTVLALGLPDMFHSIETGHFDNHVMVAGYIIMRVAMLVMWGRVALTAPAYRKTALTYIVTLAVAQVGWAALSAANPTLTMSLLLTPILIAIEVTGPFLAERSKAETPWHAHHIAERYGLLAIIALGEGVIGTVASVGAVVAEHGWSMEAALVVIAGIGLTFSMWWLYFDVPFGDLLHAHRERSFLFGYGHILLFAAIAAVGAGLHVAAYVVAGEASIGDTTAVASVAMPVLVYFVVGFVIRSAMAGPDRRVLGLALATSAILLLSIGLTNVGVGMGACLIVAMLAPMVSVVGFEILKHRDPDFVTS